MVIDIKFKRILDFKDRIINYVYAEDNLFLNDNDKNFIKKANNFLKDIECFQNFTNDVALNYLLRKKKLFQTLYCIFIRFKKNTK